MADPLNPLRDEDTCTLLAERDEGPTTLEYLAAELWVRYHFEREFEARPGSTWVTHQLDRITEHWGTPAKPKGQSAYPRVTAEPPDPVLKMALRVLGEDLRNPLSPAKVKQIREMLDPESGTPAVRIIEAIRTLSPGGALKPDMLGIQSYVPDLTLEALEVCTRKTQLATYEDLKTELSILEDPCARRMRLELAAMQGGATKQLPFNVAAMASTWRLHPALMTLPLPLKINVERGEQTVDWLCFWPTNRVNLENHPPAVGRPGYDGLVVYHIHRLPLRSLNIPSAVRAVVLKALREWDRQRERSAAPVLIPELAAALQANRRTFTPEGERFLLGLGGVALLAIFGWVAIEAGIIVGLGAVAKSGLAGLAASPELFTGAIATAARLAKDLWPIISQVQYSLPR